MPNSTVTLQSVIDFARTIPDLSPVLAVGGFEQQPALTIANHTLTSMFAPGINWKFNRFILPQFYTNSYQQDYALSAVAVGWIEHGFLVDVNNTATPPPVWSIEVVRDLEVTSFTSGRIGQISWLPNDQLVYGTWAPSTRYQQILGTPQNPGTAPTQIKDPNGNLWVVSNNLNATVTTGSVQPTWPTSPSYPTYSNPTVVAGTVTDGSVVWQVVNPKGQGIRVNPLPSQSGLYYQVNCVAQMRPPQLTSVSQTIDPVPDDYAAYFRDGFVAHAYRHAKDPKVRARFREEFSVWQGSMQEALSKSAREREALGFYPSEGLSYSGYGSYIGPANPYNTGGL